MDATARYVAGIRAVYPELPIRTAHLDRSGQNNDLVVIDGAVVFRFPRYAAGVQALAREIAILLAVAPRVPLPVPELRYVHLGAGPGEVFAGYERLPGVPLWPANLRGLEDDARRRLAGQLLSFLRALHGVPPAAVEHTLTVSDARAACIDLLARFKQHLFPHMRASARQQVERDFAAFLGDPRHFAYGPVLRHGDFGPSNILWDAQRVTITGIIDWGSAGLGDPAEDFAGLLCRAGYGESFLLSGADVYPEMPLSLERARFHASTFALAEALFGIENDDRAAFESGIADYV